MLTARATAPAGQSKLISADGKRSENWEAAKRRVEKIIDEKFRVSSAERMAAYPVAFSKLPEATLTTTTFWEQLGTFFVHEYLIPRGQKNQGEGLSCGVVCNYLSIALNLAANRFKYTGSAQAKLFFTCLDNSACTDSGKWWRCFKKEVQKVIFQRAVKDGDEMDQSATPVYPCQIRLIIRALAKVGTREATLRALAILIALLSAGRSSEPAWASFERMEFDANFDCAFLEVWQTKVSKVKLVALPPGATRHECFALLLGDHLCFGRPLPQDSDDRLDMDIVDWVIPELHHTRSPGTALGVWMKALLPGAAGAKHYQSVAIRDLPSDVCAGGIRPGAHAPRLCPALH